MTSTIRPARPEDLEAITAIYRNEVLHHTATYELEPPDVAEMTRRYDALVSPGYPYLVAETESGVVGSAYAGPYRSRPAYRWTVEDSVYLAEAAQGRGLGKALLSALIDACEASGYRQMVAVIGGSEHDASIRLHAALGFAHVGVMPATGFKFGRWIDTVIMQRPLGPGADDAPSEPRMPG